MPALTVALVTAAAAVIPETVVGPVAFKVKSDTRLEPPLSLVRVLTRVSLAGSSLLLMAQTAVSPSVSVKLLPASVPAEQLQAPAVYPDGPVSESA